MPRRALAPQRSDGVRASLAALVATLALASTVGARTANAQTSQATAPRASTVTPVERSRAFVVNGGPLLGIRGVGLFARINPEWQLHRGTRFEGHTFNIGPSIMWWPNEGGPSVSLSARYQFDHQLVPGTPFFVSPYVGLEAGMGFFNLLGEDSEPRFVFVGAPIAGLEVKLLIGQRLVLGFRPIGLTMPFFIAPERFEYDLLYDISFTIGSRY